MRLLISQIVFCLFVIVASTTAVKYRTHEMELALRIFKIFFENDGKHVTIETGENSTPSELARSKFVVRTQGKDGKNRSRAQEFIGYIVYFLNSRGALELSPETEIFLKNKQTQITDETKNTLTPCDMVRMIDPINASVLGDRGSPIWLAKIIFMWMDINGNWEITWDEFVKFYSEELQALPKNQLHILFKDILNNKGTIITLAMFEEHSNNFCLLHILTHDRLYSYEEFDVQVAVNFFRELDKDDGKPGDEHLSAKEAGTKYLKRLHTEATKAILQIKSGKDAEGRATEFKKWIQQLVYASHDKHLNRSSTKMMPNLTQVQLGSDEFGIEEMIALMDPVNSEILKRYDINVFLPRVVFDWMDSNGNKNVSKFEFIQMYVKVLKVYAKDVLAVEIFEYIRKTKAEFGHGDSINMVQWEEYCGEFWNPASVLSARAVIAG